MANAPTMPYSLIFLDKATELTSPDHPLLNKEFKVERCDSAHRALEKLRSAHFDLILLGATLLEMSGIDFLKILRGMDFGKKFPVIFLPGEKAEDTLAGAFALGVEDYLPKPYDERELLMRIKAVLRRKSEQLEHTGGELTIAGIYIDPSQRKCLVDGKNVRLRPLEFNLLETLMRRSSRVLTRAYLLTTVWEMDSLADTRAVDAMISRLRRSLGRRAGKLIETISKMGYSFRDPG